MKKAIISAISVMAVMFFTTTGAQAQTEKTPVKTTQTEDGRREIKSSELPDAIQKKVSSDEYKGWELQETAFWVKNTEKGEFYEVQLKNVSTGAVKSVNFNKEGKVL